MFLVVVVAAAVGILVIVVTILCGTFVQNKRPPSIYNRDCVNMCQGSGYLGDVCRDIRALVFTRE